MQIRYAVTSDLDAIAAVEAQCFPAAEAAPRTQLANRLAAYPNHFWLLEEEGQLISFVDGMVTDEPILRDEMYENVALHTETGAWQMIFGVNTVPSHRRQGCAAQLLRRVIADARAQERRGVVLTCKAHLTHYYAKFGFLDEGISASTHGGAVWHDMRLKL